MDYPCKLEQVEPQHALSIRTRTTAEQLPERFGEALAAIMSYMQELGAAPTGAPFAAYYNMDMQNLDVEIGFPVAKELPGRGDIQPSTIPGGKVATCLFTGPYPELGKGYDALTQFVQAGGYEPTGVAYEFYLNSPVDTPPEQLQTRIAFPLK
ncbi:MAG: GyrI-like domain-containing protein [Chloroflexi bacterium]|jgi:effector-binding domain-containing protein|nr:GyrI-like domain-containing protein [Chloroflexota bacterium]